MWLFWLQVILYYNSIWSPSLNIPVVSKYNYSLKNQNSEDGVIQWKQFYTGNIAHWILKLSYFSSETLRMSFNLSGSNFYLQNK